VRGVVCPLLAPPHHAHPTQTHTTHLHHAYHITRYTYTTAQGFTALGLLLNLEIVAVARFVNLNPEVAVRIA
jgi:hypothetical protein